MPFTVTSCVDVSEGVFEAVGSEFRRCWVTPYQQTTFSVVLLWLVVGCFGFWGRGEVEMRIFGKVALYSDASSLISFSLAKGEQVYRFTVLFH